MCRRTSAPPTLTAPSARGISATTKPLPRGGTGLVIVGATSPNHLTNRSTVTNLVADADTHIPGLARLAASMHRYGAKCAVQLQHAGRQASLPRDGKQASNDVAVSLPWSQSHAIVYANADEKRKTVHVLTTDEVIEIVDEFSEAAWRVKQAGFDAVELHAAHGYLISQFMSPYLNHRIDRFGGTFENRVRFPLAIIQSIHDKCGRGFPVLFRYSADEWVPGRERAARVRGGGKGPREGGSCRPRSQPVHPGEPGGRVRPNAVPRGLDDVCIGGRQEGGFDTRHQQPFPSQPGVLRDACSPRERPT